MAIYKGFRAQIVDGTAPNANILADLGFFALPILSWGSNAPTGYNYVDNVNYFSSYTPDYEHIGGVNVSGSESYSKFMDSYTKLSEIAPITVNRLIVDSGVAWKGNYLRFMNETGFYALSYEMGPVGSSSVSKLYDSKGALVSSSDIQPFAYGNASSVCTCSCLVADISGDTVVSVKQRYDLQGYPLNGSTYYCAAFNINDPSLAKWLNGCAQYVEHNDPYNNGGTTTNNGGGGTFGGGNTIFGGASDSIDIPPLPTASASSAGFITLFNPSLAQLNNLANYMWSDLFSLDTFKKIFADPMDCILGLSIVPVKPASTGTSAVKIGNVSTDVSMNKTSSQYVAVDCGTIDVKEYWGAYLDYAPYTQCEIYLPYVGTKQISVDDVMNKAVHVVYHVDILSGACNAYVKCGDSVLYTFVGQCSSSIPISGNDWTNVLNGAISVAGKIGLAMATGGATALMSGLGAASSIISSSKPTVERSGAMSSTGGLLGIQKPYLILTRPKQALPENQNKYTGYPSFITMALSDCTGYTEIDSVHLENMSCTDEEAQEIENLLKSGVIF